jgi:hypothetical protein
MQQPIKKKTEVVTRNTLPALQPSDLPELIRLLGSCLSEDSRIQKPAEQTLHDIEKRNGYMSLLHVCQSTQRLLLCVSFINTRFLFYM